MVDAALRQLSEQVAGLNSAIRELTARVANLEGSGAEPAPTRTTGYVNWSKSHDVIKTQRWVKLTTIKEFIGQMESLWYFGTGMQNLDNLPTSDCAKTVTENDRFPQDGAYVNIYSPSVSSELSALKLQPTRPGVGLLQRFDANCKDDVHTFSSFEEKYQLRWN